jgi:UDP-N-acetylmuramate--alanine ligase
VAALPEFKGPRRRFETKGRPRGIWIVDDYGHHPTEVAAVLRAARSAADGDVWIAFQPHTTHRTAALLDDFGRAFGDAHHALVLPIYRPTGRETEPQTVSSEDLVAKIQASGHTDARVVESFEAACDAAGRARPGDMVLTMGAGDVTRLSDMLVEVLG